MPESSVSRFTELCHDSRRMLGHEEAGMMGVIRVAGPSKRAKR